MWDYEILTKVFQSNESEKWLTETYENDVIALIDPSNITYQPDMSVFQVSDVSD